MYVGVTRILQRFMYKSQVSSDKCVERRNIRYSHKFEKYNEPFHTACIQIFVGWLRA